jgi:hypothetical protein
MRRMVKITPESEVTVVDVPTYEDIQKQVGLLTDYAGVMFEPRYHLIYDADGATLNKEVNALATLLVGSPWTGGDFLVGDVLVAKAADRPEETIDGWGDDPDIAVHVLQLVAQKVKAAMLQ